MSNTHGKDSPRGDGSTFEMWFEFGSNYSYLAAMRVEALAKEAGLRLVWKPFLLGPIFKDLGWASSPFVVQKEKGAYVWKDMERQCAKYGLPWKMPTTFPRSAILPMKVAVRYADEEWIGRFCKEVFLLNFSSDQEIDSEQAVTSVLEGLGLVNAKLLIDEAIAPANKSLLRQQTECAKALGIFGAPMFIANGDMFWGNDRLEDAIAHAASSRAACSHENPAI